MASPAPHKPVALVSGANRGIGAEIARQLAQDHGLVVLRGAREPATDDEVQLDVTDPDSVDALAVKIASEYGRLDVLVNNAGIAGGSYNDSFEESQIDEIKDVIETNLYGAWRLTQAMLPLLRASEHPRVVNVSSGAGQLTEMGGGSHPYRVSKAGLNVLTRTLAADGDVIVNSMCPGWVRTDMGGEGADLSVEEGADTAVWLATLPDDGPTGGFFKKREPIPW
jgi:NAD(P)-dependent dehydrogenase (short-subunit alcohol dehydrogenase family)